MLLPIRCARSMLELVEQCGHAVGEVGRVVRAAMSGLSESPKPGRSSAMTRWRSARAATVGRNERLRPAEPVDADHRDRRRPRRAWRSCRSRVTNGVEAKPAIVGEVAGGGEKADPEVEVLANAELARCGMRSMPAAHVAGDPLPGGSVGAQEGVGLLSGRWAAARSSRSASMIGVPLAARRRQPGGSARCRLGTSMTSGSKRSARVTSAPAGPSVLSYRAVGFLLATNCSMQAPRSLQPA